MPETMSSSPRYEPLVLAAPDAPALTALGARVAEELASSPCALADLGLRLATQGPHAAHRRVVFARDLAEAIRVLRAAPPQTTVDGVAGPAPRIGFLFPGVVKTQGLGELYTAEPVFARAIDRCAAFAQQRYGLDLRAQLEAGDQAGAAPEAAEQLCFLFAVGAGLNALWHHWGVRPSVALGFSFGELVAACTVGIFTPEDALALVDERARLFAAMPPGTMTSVALSEAAARALLSDEPELQVALQVAIERTATSCVISGPVAAMAALEQRLAARGIGHQKLEMSFAGHSVMATQAAEPFARAFAGVARRAPETRLVSCVTGELLDADAATSPAYWGRQVHDTVRFATGIGTMLREGCRLLLEVGPGHYLTSMASQQTAKAGHVVCQPSIRPASGSPSPHLGILRSLARLWTLGVEVDWRAFYAGRATG